MIRAVFIAALCHWLKNLASLSQPIGSKTKIMTCLHAFGAAYMYVFRGLSVSVVNGQSKYFDSGLRHSNENRCSDSKQ